MKWGLSLFRMIEAEDAEKIFDKKIFCFLDRIRNHVMFLHIRNLSWCWTRDDKHQGIIRIILNQTPAFTASTQDQIVSKAGKKCWKPFKELKINQVGRSEQYKQIKIWIWLGAIDYFCHLLIVDMVRWYPNLLLPLYLILIQTSDSFTPSKHSSQILNFLITALWNLQQNGSRHDKNHVF